MNIGNRGEMMDIVFIVITCGFYLASWGFVRLCERI